MVGPNLLELPKPKIVVIEKASAEGIHVVRGGKEMQYKNFDNMEQLTKWHQHNPHVRVISFAATTIKNFFMGDYSVTTVWYFA